MKDREIEKKRLIDLNANEDNLMQTVMNGSASKVTVQNPSLPRLRMRVPSHSRWKAEK